MSITTLAMIMQTSVSTCNFNTTYPRIWTYIHELFTKKKNHKIWHPIKIDGRNQFASAVEIFLTRVAPNIIELTSNKQIIYSISKLNSVRVRASRYNTRCDAMPCAGRASGARFPPICRARRPPRPLIKIISTWIRHDGPNT